MPTIEQELKLLPNFHALGPAAKAIIESAESELGLTFSPDYAQYLEAFTMASANGHELTGLCESKRLNVVDVTLEERKAHRAAKASWYVIERVGIDGALAWQSGDGAVYQTTAHSSAVKISDSLIEYLKR